MEDIATGVCRPSGQDGKLTGLECGGLRRVFVARSASASSPPKSGEDRRCSKRLLRLGDFDLYERWLDEPEVVRVQDERQLIKLGVVNCQ